jgi:hypothetical protein
VFYIALPLTLIIQTLNYFLIALLNEPPLRVIFFLELLQANHFKLISCLQDQVHLFEATQVYPLDSPYESLSHVLT